VAHKVVILGGGVGGTIVANLLEKRLGSGADITVIDREGKHFYEPGLIFAMLGGIDPAKLTRPERTLLRKHVKLLIGEAKRIDAEGKAVEMADGTRLPYDDLVLAPGARLDPSAVPGFEGNAHHFYHGPAALALRTALQNFEGGTVLLGPSSLPYKCPPAPIEATLLLEAYFKKHPTKRPVKFRYISPIGRAFTIESVSPVVEKLFAERGIELSTFFNVESIDGAAKEVVSLEGERAAYDLLILAPPHRGPKIAEASGLSGPGGWIPTDRTTLRVKGQDHIFAIGDATDLPLSKAGSTAHFEAPIVADEIASAVLGETVKELYNGHVMCFFETGYGKGMVLDFNYDHPPKVDHPTRLAHLEKLAFNKMYWAMIPTARV
jgi:sulfide:quinone oxidoreductase